MLSQRALNRALLARQGLLEPLDLRLPRALERVGGLQAQYAPSMYVGLWSRLRLFARDELTAALHDRSAIQGTLMRVTIHLVSREDYWPLAVATRAARRTWWLRAVGPEAPSPRAMAAGARTLRRALHEAGGTLTKKEIDALLGRRRAHGIGLWIDLVRVPPSGTWERRRADVFAAAEDWVGSDGSDVSERAAIEHLVRRYLTAFGPASARDVASFTGLPPAALRPVLERMHLRELGEELLDVDGGPLPDPATPAPPRFLPTWDATLLVHARRTGLLPEEHRPKLFSIKTPHSFPSFTVDGAVAGTWRHENGAIVLEPFGRLDGATRRALREEADRLAQLHA